MGFYNKITIMTASTIQQSNASILQQPLIPTVDIAFNITDESFTKRNDIDLIIQRAKSVGVN